MSKVKEAICTKEEIENLLGTKNRLEDVVESSRIKEKEYKEIYPKNPYRKKSKDPVKDVPELYIVQS